MTAVDATAERLLHLALDAFAEEGFAAVDPGRIAERAGCDLADLYRHFPRKEAFVARLYERLATDLEERVAELPDGTVGQRFGLLVEAKLASVEAHRDLLRHLLAAMLDPSHSLGVLGRSADEIRGRVRGVFSAVVHGATDAPPAERRDRVVRFLYAIHLALVFLHLQDQGEPRHLSAEALSIAVDVVELAGRFLGRTEAGLAERVLSRALGLPEIDDLLDRIDRVVGPFVAPPHDSARLDAAENILRDLFRFRRLQPGAGPCADDPCPQCLALHRPRVEARLVAGLPIHLVLPAFPAKSASRRKTIGSLPDLGEELALRFLDERCRDIARHHRPGARLTICSDGRVFSDLVGVGDDDVTAYRLALIEMIDRLGLESIDVFDLDDVHPETDYPTMRAWLVERYADPLEDLVARTKRFEHHQHLYNGIHRFLTEDLGDRQPELSRSAARKRTADDAYRVIQRSNAWTRLIAGCFPGALRLSIHPQPPHSEKIGILLTPAEDSWLTPWHGVALLQEDRFVLTRRAEAEDLGARLVEKDGRPSHFEI